MANLGPIWSQKGTAMPTSGVSISRQWVKIFEFRKKRLNLHMQDIKICEREKKSKIFTWTHTPYRRNVGNKHNQVVIAKDKVCNRKRKRGDDDNDNPSEEPSEKKKYNILW